MNPDDFQVIEMLVIGWVFGIMTCLLYASISNYRKTKRRNRRQQDLLDAGVDVLTVLSMDL